MSLRFTHADLDYLLGAARDVPKVISRAKEVAESWQEIGRRGRESYEATHWGKRGNAQTRGVAAPDPETGVAELGRIVAIEYFTEKGDDGESIYRHEFEGVLPTLGYTHEERPSGLVVLRTGSRYRVTRRGIEG